MGRPAPGLQAKPAIRRRELFRRGATVAAAVGGGALAEALTQRRTHVHPAVPAAIRDPRPGEHPLVRMQRELHRALAKPVEQRQWVMVVDTRRCIGCDACTVACIAEHGLPPGVSYRTVVKVETGEFPHVEAFFKPTNCMQCDRPPCLPAANAVSPGAMAKRPDGIVAVDYVKFHRRAYEAARKACPYNALSFDDGRYWTQGTPTLQAYETRPKVEYGRVWTRANGALPIGAGRKCHFCLQRIEAGLLPACVATCIGGALYFGDAGDPDSLVSELRRQQKAWRVNESLGTEPRMYYLGAASRKTMPAATPESCQACHGR
ncbi:MAG: 4Fe-4S dicluster domain-containing protein [Armatimonadota bacterium]|nr:4Fe-4S dicluster domain-containing protein [Armatimonadota bacterium]MDR7520507.1 4Fe-4S dicluster domain-containing protein [Armatimonadota bacterium]MDR7550212.1 4Fe-4S dicluster domain-containing protein [Armatimonadota bacterium]